MAHLPLADVDGDPYYKIIGNRPEVLAAWAALDKAILGPSSKLPVELKEEARRALAQNVGCAYCATVGGKPSKTQTDPKVALAVAFASQIASDYRQIDGSTFEVLRQEFTNEQIAELVIWLCFKFGSNLLGAIVKLEPATEVDVKGYTQFLDTVAA